MSKITSVLSMAYFCFVYGQAYAELGSTYSECLRQAREALKEKIQHNCAVGSDAAGDKDTEAFQKCVEEGSKEQLSDEANKKCVERAEANSGYSVDQGTPADSTILGITASDGTGPSEKVPTPRRRPKDAGTGATASSTPKAKSPTGSTTPSKNSSTNTTGTRSTPSATSSTGLSPSTDIVVAQIEADRDVAACVASMSTASECCNNPMACTDRLNSTDSNSLGSLGNSLRNGPASGGLTDYCKQMNTLGYDTGNVNTGLSGICYNSHSSCSDTCGGLARKYKRYLEICIEGCEAEDIYTVTLRILVSRQASCDSLRGRSDQLALTGLGTSNNQALANYCSQLASASSAGSSGSTPKSNSPFINNILAANCEANPESADCRGLSVKDGKVGFDEKNRPVKADDFNVGTPAQGYRAPTQASESDASAAKVGRVANNSGGQMLGGENSSEAKLPPKAGLPRTQASSASSSEEGLRGGGGYSPPPGSNRGEDEDHFMNRNIGGNGSQFESVDLRQFLPGGSRARRLAGMSEINAKEEDIFLRITNKMNEKCRLGVLWQCR